ncbi:MAG: delta-60 repeat domain-containing protein [Chthoniobacterales bacterium]
MKPVCSLVLGWCVAFSLVSTAASRAADFTAPSAEELANQQWGSDDAASKPSANQPARSVFNTGEGVSGTVYAAVGLPDGSVILGGEFSTVDSQPRMNLAKILPDGTLDTTMFGKVTDGVNGTVYALELDSQGGVIVGGYFSEAQEKPRQNLVRYNPDGSLDLTFGGVQLPNGPNGQVRAIAIQPDGHIVVGGEFSMVGTFERRNVAKLNPDGTVAGPQTASTGVGGTINALTVTSTGAVVAGGMFEVAGSTTRGVTTVAP